MKKFLLFLIILISVASQSLLYQKCKLIKCFIKPFCKPGYYAYGCCCLPLKCGENQYLKNGKCVNKKKKKKKKN